MHSYQHNIKTFNNATRHLTRVERSLYRDLIELYYDSEKPLPADNFDRLARLALANTDDEKAALRYVLSEFFTESNGFYVHDYCDGQIEKFYSNTTAKALAGKASAKARQEKQEQRKREREKDNQTPVEQNSTDAQQNPTNHKTSNHNKPVNNLKDITPQAADHVLEIFEYWKAQLKHPKAKLDDKRKKLINNALKLGYEPHDLMDAIEGCSKSPYHMGCDGRNTTVYDDLELILRDAKHIDQFLKVNLNPPAPSGVNYGSHQQPNRPSSQQHGLAHDDTKWADELFGSESPAVDRFDQQGIQVIEGDFSSVGGGDQRP